jgi:hypothetical protein
MFQAMQRMRRTEAIRTSCQIPCAAPTEMSATAISQFPFCIASTAEASDRPPMGSSSGDRHSPDGRWQSEQATLNSYFAPAAVLIVAFGTAMAAAPKPESIRWTAADHARAADATFAAIPLTGPGTRQPSLWDQLAAASIKGGDARAKEAALRAGSIRGKIIGARAHDSRNAMDACRTSRSV